MNPRTAFLEGDSCGADEAAAPLLAGTLQPSALPSAPPHDGYPPTATAYVGDPPPEFRLPAKGVDDGLPASSGSAHEQQVGLLAHACVPRAVGDC